MCQPICGMMRCNMNGCVLFQKNTLASSSLFMLLYNPYEARYILLRLRTKKGQYEYAENDEPCKPFSGPSSIHTHMKADRVHEPGDQRPVLNRIPAQYLPHVWFAHIPPVAIIIVRNINAKPTKRYISSSMTFKVAIFDKMNPHVNPFWYFQNAPLGYKVPQYLRRSIQPRKQG